MFNFSYRQEIYDEKKERYRRFLKWKNFDKVWYYGNCVVDVIGMEKNRVRIVVRRKFSGHSKFMNSDFEVNLMLGFVITGVKKDDDTLRFDVEQNQDKHYGQIEDKHRELYDVKISGKVNEINKLYEKIKQKIGNPPDEPHIFACDLHNINEFMPVIYQPRIDAWNNFLREINIHKDSQGYEVTLVFEDEKLRRHWIFDFLYRVFRWAWYGRTLDIETFCVNIKNKEFTFSGIYSGDDTLFDDSTHHDKEKDGTIEKRAIKYFYQDHNHPIVFVNTSNHALAPHDNNHDFWKWEYIPWRKNIPIKSEKITKKQTEEKYRKWLY